MLILELFKNRQYFCELLGLGANLPGGREIGRVTTERLLQPRHLISALLAFNPIANLDDLVVPGYQGCKGFTY